MRTPLGRVRHLGSAHGGTDHFWMERLTGAASLVLTFVAIVVVLMVAGKPHADAVAVLGRPVIAALLALYVAAVAMHMRLGMAAIIEDYVGDEARKIGWLVANTFFSILIATVGIVAILKIAVG